MTEFPQSCPYGHTPDDLRLILGDRYSAFCRWFSGQTGMFCDGRLFDHDTRKYVPSPCEAHPHGAVVYPSDLRRFLTGRGPVDW